MNQYYKRWSHFPKCIETNLVHSKIDCLQQTTCQFWCAAAYQLSWWQSINDVVICITSTRLSVRSVPIPSSVSNQHTSLVNRRRRLRLRSHSRPLPEHVKPTNMQMLKGFKRDDKLLNIEFTLPLESSLRSLLLRSNAIITSETNSRGTPIDLQSVGKVWQNCRLIDQHAIPSLPHQSESRT